MPETTPVITPETAPETPPEIRPAQTAEACAPARPEFHPESHPESHPGAREAVLAEALSDALARIATAELEAAATRRQAQADLALGEAARRGLGQTLDKAEARIAALEEARTQTEASLSWRVTAPLRWLSARFRG